MTTFNFFSRQITPEEQRAHLKKEGLLPPKQYNEAPMFMASTGTIFDPYVPPEGDGRASILSKEVRGTADLFNPFRPEISTKSFFNCCKQSLNSLSLPPNHQTFFDV